MNIDEELRKLNDNQKQELEKWFVEQIYKVNKVNKNDQLNYVPYVTKKHEGKYYNNLNLKTGVYSNPEVTTEQINLIDKAIQELKYKSK